MKSWKKAAVFGAAHFVLEILVYIFGFALGPTLTTRKLLWISFYDVAVAITFPFVYLSEHFEWKALGISYATNSMHNQAFEGDGPQAERLAGDRTCILILGPMAREPDLHKSPKDTAVCQQRKRKVAPPGFALIGRSRL